MDKKSVDPLPCLLVDTREQTPLTFSHLQSAPATLQSGDYSVRGLEDVFAVERKSISDLVGSLKSGRDRFMRELHRLRGFTFARLLVVGTAQELATLVARGRVSLDMVEHSLLSIEQRYGVPVVRVDTPEQAALRVESWAFTAWRDAAAKLGLRLPFPEWCAGDALRLNRPASISEILTHASDEDMP
ncbi:MAG: ERCC4 domain-containing protein [Akkermansiaceae bacterium]|nr:ERCC4 domain-containing protein [Akkermansiaceae bacterium]